MPVDLKKAREMAQLLFAEGRLISYTTINSRYHRAAEMIRDLANEVERLRMSPIPVILFCPRCRTQHIDAPGMDQAGGIWTNPPRRTHLCTSCGHQWRVADVPTTGVASLDTKGENDRSPVPHGPRNAQELVNAARKVLREAYSRGTHTISIGSLRSLEQLATAVDDELKLFLDPHS